MMHLTWHKMCLLARSSHSQKNDIMTSWILIPSASGCSHLHVATWNNKGNVRWREQGHWNRVSRKKFHTENIPYIFPSFIFPYRMFRDLFLRRRKRTSVSWSVLGAYWEWQCSSRNNFRQFRNHALFLGRWNNRLCHIAINFFSASSLQDTRFRLISGTCPCCSLAWST